MPEEQKLLHIVTEMLAIPVGIYLITLGIMLSSIGEFNRIALIIIGAGNLIIDGYLLINWFK